MLELINALTAELNHYSGDKAAMHGKAKELLAAVQAVVRNTKAGADEFKWSAKARKALTKAALSKHANPSLMVARGDGDVWHTNGYYAVQGEPSGRFDPFDVIEMPIHQMRAVIPAVPGEMVTVVGIDDKNPDYQVLSNGTRVDRLYLAYVMATVGGDVTLHQASPLGPISVRRGAETRGVVMPINPSTIGGK